MMRLPPTGDFHLAIDRSTVLDRSIGEIAEVVRAGTYPHGQIEGGENMAVLRCVHP